MSNRYDVILKRESTGEEKNIIEHVHDIVVDNKLDDSLPTGRPLPDDHPQRRGRDDMLQGPL